VNGSNVTISFDGLPSFTFGRYELSQNDSLLREFRSGGKLTWYETNWSAHNYTVAYYNDTAGPVLSLSLETGSLTEGGDIKIKCSSSDVSGVSSSSLTVTDSGGDDYSLNCGQEFTETGLTGSYTVSYSATDKAGNGNSVSRTFDVASSDSGGGGGSSGGGSSSVSTGISDSHSWFSANRDRFSFESIDEAVGVRSVAVSTDRNLSGFSLSVTRMETEPSLPELPENAYQFYEFTAENEEEITSTEIEFRVEKSFADEHDEIIVSHYENGWKDLPTTRVDSTGSTWIYKTSANGFSYYAVRGENQVEDENQNTGSQNQTRNQTEPVCGDNTCSKNEDWRSCQQDCQKPQKITDAESAVSNAEGEIQKGEKGYETFQKAQQSLESREYSQAENLAQQAIRENQQIKQENSLPVLLIIGGLLGLTVLLTVGYIGYRKWLNNRIGTEVNQIHQDIAEKVRNRQDVEQEDRIINEIDGAEEELRQDKPWGVKKHLDKVLEMLGLQ
jgi:PGF-pre-PGF domain-containing protein